MQQEAAIDDGDDAGNGNSNGNGWDFWQSESIMLKNDCQKILFFQFLTVIFKLFIFWLSKFSAAEIFDSQNI